MSFKCSLGLHTWDHCTCSSCGKNRGEQHLLINDCEKCEKCGATFENQHDWSFDCNKCHKCGKTRSVEHSWKNDCEKCSSCKETRVNHHQLVNGVCQVCGRGTYTDEKDGVSYRIVKVGNQIVMADNYLKIPDKGKCWAYDNEEKNTVKNGYLYDWEAAKNLAPNGWHLPSKAEWEKLLSDLGGSNKEAFEQLKVGGSSGFEGVYGGWRLARGTFSSLGASGHYWSSTEDSEKEVWQFKLSAYAGVAELEKGEKTMGLSIRFFRD